MRYSYFFMRHRRTLKKVGLAFVGMAVCTIVLWRIDRDLSYARDYSFVFDRKLSSQAQRAIAGATSSAIKTAQAAPSQLIEQLHKQFDFIKNIAVFTIPGSRAIAKIAAHKPLCLLDNNLALLSNGKTIDQQLLATPTIAQTPHVAVEDWFAGDGGIPARLAPFLKALGQERMNSFNVTWHGDHEVVLTPKETPTFCLVIEAREDVTNTLLAAGTTVKELLAARGILGGPRKRSWAADLRFKNQVIVYAGKRGREHGSRSF